MLRSISKDCQWVNGSSFPSFIVSTEYTAFPRYTTETEANSLHEKPADLHGRINLVLFCRLCQFREHIKADFVEFRVLPRVDMLEEKVEYVRVFCKARRLTFSCRWLTKVSWRETFGVHVQVLAMDTKKDSVPRNEQPVCIWVAD